MFEHDKASQQLKQKVINWAVRTRLDECLLNRVLEGELAVGLAEDGDLEFSKAEEKKDYPPLVE